MFQTHNLDEYPMPNRAANSEIKLWPYLKQVNPSAWFHVTFIDETTKETIVIMSLSLERVLREVEYIKNFDIQMVCPPKEGWSDRWKMLLIMEIYRAFVDVENEFSGNIGFIVVTEFGGELLLSTRGYENEIGEKLVNNELIYKR